MPYEATIIVLYYIVNIIYIFNFALSQLREVSLTVREEGRICKRQQRSRSVVLVNQNLFNIRLGNIGCLLRLLRLYGRFVYKIGVISDRLIQRVSIVIGFARTYTLTTAPLQSLTKVLYRTAIQIEVRHYTNVVACFRYLLASFQLYITFYQQLSQLLEVILISIKVILDITTIRIIQQTAYHLLVYLDIKVSRVVSLQLVQLNADNVTTNLKVFIKGPSSLDILLGRS